MVTRTITWRRRSRSWRRKRRSIRRHRRSRRNCWIEGGVGERGDRKLEGEGRIGGGEKGRGGEEGRGGGGGREEKTKQEGEHGEEQGVLFAAPQI